MEIDYRKINPEQMAQLFPIFEKYMRGIIENSVGWDEAFQKEEFSSKLKPEWFRWVYVNGQQAGLICVQQKPTEMYLYLIILFEEFQGKGLARALMLNLKSSAERQNLNLAWSCLSNNKKALRLYDAMPNVSRRTEGLFYRYVWR